MIFGAIVAGGVGSRMKISKYPKQFLPLGDSKKPILIHTLEKFVLCPRFDQIYIGVHADWLGHMENLIEKYLPQEKERITVVCGGAYRNGTILNVVS